MVAVAATVVALVSDAEEPFISVFWVSFVTSVAAVGDGEDDDDWVVRTILFSHPTYILTEIG